jgi:hypothetical protein
MAQTEQRNHFDELEFIVDQSSIQNVINMLARICHEKAEHVETNWQDAQLARVWRKNADVLASAAEKLQRTF